MCYNVAGVLTEAVTSQRGINEVQTVMRIGWRYRGNHGARAIVTTFL